MPVNPQTFIEDFSRFADETLQYCQSKAERESRTIVGALDEVMKDIQRRSAMSQKAQEAFQETNTKVLEALQGPDALNTNELLKQLKALGNENTDVKSAILPVIEALQFQDKLNQNIESMRALLLQWEQREPELRSAGSEDAPAKEYVEAVLQNVSNAEDRAIIRSSFGLPEEKHLETENRNEYL